MNKMITITRVASKNVIKDYVGKIQNMLGMNITTYEKMVDKAIFHIEEELMKRKIKLKWYRYETTQLTDGAMSVMIYGDKK